MVAVSAESIPPDRPRMTEREAVLADVVPDPGDQRRVHLGELGQPRPDQSRFGVCGGRGKRGGKRERRQGQPLERDHGAVLRVDRSRAGAGHRRVGGGHPEIGDDERLGELRAAGQQGAGRVDDDRIAVEDQLVLAAHQVDVGEHGAGLAGPPLAEVEPGVVLAPLVRRRVGHDQQAGARLAGHRDRAAVLPEVLADRDRHVHRILAGQRQPEDRHAVAGDEDPVLVEDAIVRQVMLGRGDGDLAAV